MEISERFAVCGGDLRQKYLLEWLLAQHAAVAAWDGNGFSTPAQTMPIKPLLHWATVVILPLPITKNGMSLYAPLGNQSLLLPKLAARLEKKKVFGGQLKALPACDALELWDYSTDPQFAMQNAAATVEGALSLAVSGSPCTLHGAACLIVGWGRIAQLLARSLQTLGAKVTVAARNPDALAMAEVLGMQAIPLKALPQRCPRWQFLWNTVPSQVIPQAVLQKGQPESVAIELASPPFGFDAACAQQLGIKVLHASGLPGSFSPRSAGEIIGQTIWNHMKE